MSRLRIYAADVDPPFGGIAAVGDGAVQRRVGVEEDAYVSESAVLI